MLSYISNLISICTFDGGLGLAHSNQMLLIYLFYLGVYTFS